MDKELVDKDKGWKYTSKTVTALLVTGTIAWFISSPSYEPLLAFFPIILGVIVSRYNSRWQIDFAVSALLIVLFLGGLTLILNPNSTEQVQNLELNNIELWKFLVIVVSVLISIILTFLWFLRRKNKISQTFLWALIGSSDNKSAEEFFGKLFRVFVSSVLWSIVTALIFVAVILILTILTLALGSEVSGTKTSIIQYGALGGVLGAFIGVVIAIGRLIKSNSKTHQRNKTDETLNNTETTKPSLRKKYLKYKGLLWKSPRFGFGLPIPLCSRNNCERPIRHERKYPPNYIISSNLQEMQEFLNKQNSYENIYLCPVHGKLQEVPDIELDTLRQEAKHEFRR